MTVPGRALILAFIVGALATALPAAAVTNDPSVARATATCTSSVGPGIPPPAAPQGGVPGFHARWAGQSGYMQLCPGERSTATVAYLNTGSNGWVAGRMGQVAYLGTWGPQPGQDAASPLGGDGQLGSPATGWPRYNRIAVQPAAYVGPGQVSWFQFVVQAPTAPGTYQLYLRPLVEGAAWMEDEGVFWTVTVPAPQGATPTPTPTPTPTAPVGTPVPVPTPTPSGGFVFPTLFPSILESRNGYVSLTVNPGASCSGVSRYPDGVTVVALATQVSPATGLLSWSYTPSPPSTNIGLHHLDCTLGSERQPAEAKFSAN